MNWISLVSNNNNNNCRKLDVFNAITMDKSLVTLTNNMIIENGLFYILILNICQEPCSLLHPIDGNFHWPFFISYFLLNFANGLYSFFHEKKRNTICQNEISSVRIINITVNLNIYISSEMWNVYSHFLSFSMPWTQKWFWKC